MFNPLEKDRRLPFGESGDLEGDWGTYVYRWTLALPRGQGVALTLGFHVDDLRDLLYIFYDDGAGDNSFAVYNLNTQVQIYLSPALADYTPTIASNTTSSAGCNLTAYNCSSSRQRYLAFCRFNSFFLEVWKDGARIFSYDVRLINPLAWIYMLHLSRRGKWIIVNYDTDLYIFEGI